MEWKTYYCYVNIPYIDLKIHTIPTKIATAFFGRNGQADPKILWECKGPWITTTIFKKTEQSRKAHIDFKTYYKAIVIKTSGDLGTEKIER